MAMPIRNFFIGLLHHVREKKSGTLVEKVAASRTRTLLPGIAGTAILIWMLAPISIHATIPISAAEANRIRRCIWKNECGGIISVLTSWNAVASFASLGFGHSTSYPRAKRG